MCQVVAYKRLKTMKIIMPSPQKVVAVAYQRWSFTRGSNRALTGKIWCFGLVVAYHGRWSHMEVRLYYFMSVNERFIH